MKPARRTFDVLLGILVAATVLPVYLLTFSRTVTAEDCGELAASVYTLGVVHPTGYPLFTLAGWMFSHLPLGHSVIWRLNLFGVTLCTVSAILFFQAILFFFSPGGRTLFKVTGKSGPARTAAITGTLTFAFSRVYWSEALSLEVYALHLVFLALVTRLYLQALSTDGAPRAKRTWILFAFVLGLGFTNHMMMVLLAPAFLYLFFTVHGGGAKAWKLIATAVVPFVAGLSLYLYLPLRAVGNPLMNWGNPSSPKALWYHLTAGQYHGQMFSSLDIALRKTAQFFVDLPRDFGYVPLLVAVMGAGALYLKARRLLIFLALIFFTGVIYSVNYAFDDPNFNLNAHFAVSVCAAFGVYSILNAVRPGWYRAAFAACVVSVLFPLAVNYAASNKRQDRAVEEYARNVLSSLDSGAVYFTHEYQRMAAPAFYLQIVEGVRPDVAVIDIVLLANPWYIPHLQSLHPWLIRNSQREFDAYLPELLKFVNGQADTLAYNARVQDLFLSILRNSGPKHPVYASSGINTEVAQGYRLVPSGMVFRLVPAADSASFTPKEMRFSPLPPVAYNPESEAIRNEYAESYANQGAYLVAAGDTAQGISMLRKALLINPEFPVVIEMLATLTR